MRRWVKWLALAVVALVVGALVVAVLTVRPRLADARDGVDHAWVPLRVPLVVRYQRLNGVVLALDAAGARQRAVTTDLTAALAQWQRVAATDDPGAQAPLADDLEALALRARANVQHSDRLRQNPTLQTAFAAFDQAIVNPPAVSAYNRAVQAYQRRRTSTAGRIVASLFGFGERPVLMIVGGT
ncbi:MAG TPA: hypothetical protein VLV81_07235 [Acidimicrobiia bacterium]|nr:hypothetical protein [Acidimicrobiia bacterium]